MKVPSPATLYSNFLVLWRSGSWALKETWHTSPRLLLGILISVFIQSLTPLGLALSARGIVNAVVSGMRAETVGPGVLLAWLATGLTFTILEALGRFATLFHMGRLEDNLNIRITSDILKHADSLDLSCFEDPRFQDMMARARQATGANISQFIIHALSAAKGFIQSVSIIALLIYIDPLIVLLMLPVALPYLVYQWRFSKIRYEIEHSRANRHRWNEYFTTRLTSHEFVPEIKLFGLGPLLIRKFREMMQGFKDENRKLYIRRFIVNMAFAVLSTTAAYMVFTRVAFKAVGGALTVGDVAVFGTAAVRLRISIEMSILDAAMAIEKALHVSNLREFFSVQPRMRSAAGGPSPQGAGEIELKAVSFKYPGSDGWALRDMSMHIRAGETVALVGENGAGKTTLAKLIARLYDPCEGTVLFDGRDVREIPLEDLHGRITFVFQNFGRYEATLSDNIAYGDWRRLLGDKEAIGKVAQSAGLRAMISRMPKGFDTMLGRAFGEFTLSGGQWQQIALARAFAKDAVILILDEPTSNLDARAEYELFSHYRQIAEGRTTILISHRFSTVSIADRIFLVDRGQIVESGTHGELLAKDGHYASLYRLHRRQMGSQQ